MSGSNVLFILSGSIACYKACAAISQLVQRGHRVRAVATRAALNFVGEATLEGLTREKVATDLFAAGGALDHITLARWADITVVCPATANTLNRMAAGLADATFTPKPRNEWDLCGGVACVIAAGGTACDGEGRPYLFNRPDPLHVGVIGTNGPLHDDILALTRSMA